MPRASSGSPEPPRAAQSSEGRSNEVRTVDLGDPRSAGWSFLVAADDPKRDRLIEVLRPLAEHRGMKDPGSPLVYAGEEDWFDWLTDHYTLLDVDERPHYVLIAAGPDRVPFHFQSFLDTAASTGRVDFGDSFDDLGAYVEKLIRLETAAEPAAKAEVVFFAPDGGPDDPTHYSHLYMAQPLIELVRDEGGFEVSEMLGDAATKEALVETLGASKAAVVYTASHGMADPEGTLESQQRLNGAICCQQTGGETRDEDWLFMGEDVPKDGGPFLEGAVFFQFACYGFGTPRESDFDHWNVGQPTLQAHADFCSALPQRLLAHPRGPVAYIGHVDTAWLHGFDDPQAPTPLEPWHPRLAPFRSAIEFLLECQPPGYAMGDLGKRYGELNALLTNTWDRMSRGALQMSPELEARLANQFIMRSDAQNYLVFGDPAAQVRVAS